MNKYHAVKTKIEGYTFDSKKEGQRYRDLLLLEKAGEISDLKVHPVYLLQEKFIYKGETVRKIEYEADFEYKENGYVITEDIKGGKATQTALFKIKAKMFKKKFGVYHNFRLVEE